MPPISEKISRLPQAAAMILFVSLCAVTVAAASEKKIPRSALPPAVEKTVQQQAQGATIREFTSETENGKTEYEVEMTVNGHSKDVSIAPDGTVLEVEEAVSFNSLRLPPKAPSSPAPTVQKSAPSSPSQRTVKSSRTKRTS